MATSIAPGALPPRVAVAISGLLNFVGAFLSLAVAATIASGLVNTGDVTLTVVAAGLTGGIIWNLLTWLFGIPSSSSHALIGGVVGATLAAAGLAGVEWQGLVSKVIIPAILSPFIAGLVAASSGRLLRLHLTYFDPPGPDDNEFCASALHQAGLARSRTATGAAAIPASGPVGFACPCLRHRLARLPGAGPFVFPLVRPRASHRFLRPCQLYPPR